MGASRVTIEWAQVRTKTSSARFVRLTELRKLKQCAQVAAVCYRIRGGSIEFLLVQTRKGRWIFPKGNPEPGLTHAQAAALEAFEEAGVHGRMEESSFTRYVRRGRNEARSSAARSSATPSGEKESAVSVYLCEVLRLVAPQESDRNPTWFSAGKAKRRLLQDRVPEFGAELARVLDRAVSRIQRSRGRTSSVVRAPQVIRPQAGGLQKVQFIDIRRVGETAARNKSPRTI
jgi:8-oxo-dGTP pyrophosphatase MutT (NUDIX family)